MVIVDENGNIVVPGCIRNGIPEAAATVIFDELAEFAKYGFNKSHAAAYAIIAYQTAWLKYYYPVEFTAALITSVMDNSKKVAQYIMNSKSMGIAVLPPDINESHIKFTVSGKKIRFGLAAVKNVGINAIAAIIRARNSSGGFESLYDFLQKTDLSVLNKRTVESLIKCGAFDSLGIFRSRMIAVFEKLMDSIQNQKKKNIEGQFSFFDDLEEKDSLFNDIYPEINEYPSKMLLTMEKEMLGLYVSGHPLNEFSEELRKKASVTTADLVVENDDEGIESTKEEYDGKKVIIGGIIVSIKQKTTKSNSMMAFVELEDLFGTIEIIVFPRPYDKYREFFKIENIVLIEGRVSQKEEENAKIICENVKSLNKIVEKKKLYIKIDTDIEPDIMDSIKKVLYKFKGDQPVYLVNEAKKNDKNAYRMIADRSMWVTINDDLLKKTSRDCRRKMCSSKI